MSTSKWKSGTALACLLLCATACQPGAVKPTCPISEPVHVTKTVYVALPDTLTVPVEAATPPAQALSSNGSLYDAWVHDSGQLQLCKPRLDGIIQAQPKEATP